MAVGRQLLAVGQTDGRKLTANSRQPTQDFAMRTFSDSTSPMRVLMRIPDLSPEAAPTPQREVFEQKPLAPLASAFPKDAHKAKPARANVTPEELQATGKLARALKVLAGL